MIGFLRRGRDRVHPHRADRTAGQDVHRDAHPDHQIPPAGGLDRGDLRVLRAVRGRGRVRAADRSAAGRDREVVRRRAVPGRRGRSSSGRRARATTATGRRTRHRTPYGPGLRAVGGELPGAVRGRVGRPVATVDGRPGREGQQSVRDVCRFVARIDPGVRARRAAGPVAVEEGPAGDGALRRRRHLRRARGGHRDHAPVDRRRSRRRWSA